MQAQHNNFAHVEQQPTQSVSALAIQSAIDSSQTGAGGFVAVAFLQWLDPTGVHHVVAFDPNGKKQRPVDHITCSLEGDGAERIAAFVDRHNGVHNLYFQVNEVRPNFKGHKAGDTDILRFRAIPADKDPGKGERETERVKIVDVFSDKLQHCPPSMVLDSGNGFWTFYRLAEKLINNE